MGFPAMVKGLDNSGDFPKVGIRVEVVHVDGESGGSVPLASEVGGHFCQQSMKGGMGMHAGGLGQTAEGAVKGGPQGGEWVRSHSETKLMLTRYRRNRAGRL